MNGETGENKIKFFYVLVNYYHKASNEVCMSKSIGTTEVEAVLTAVQTRFLGDRNKFLQDYAKVMIKAASLLGVSILEPHHMKGMLQAMFSVEKDILIDWLEITGGAYKLLPESLEK